MTHILTGLFIWAVAFIATPAVAASPNHCEHIIVVVQESVDSGQLTQKEADGIIKRCTKELWG